MSLLMHYVLRLKHLNGRYFSKTLNISDIYGTGFWELEGYKTSHVLNQRCAIFLKIDEFASTVQLTFPKLGDENVELKIDVVSNVALECISENRTFKDKKFMLTIIAFYIIYKNFQPMVYNSNKLEYILMYEIETCRWKFR